MDPKNCKVACNLGIVQFHKGNLKDALENLTEVNNRLPEIITPWLYISIIKLKMNEIEKAISVFEKAIDKFPRLSAFTNNFAVAYEAIDKPEEAEKLYRQTLEKNPEDWKICKNLANFYYEKQVLGAAKELYERIPPKERDWQLYFKLGNIYLHQGDNKNALESWQKAKELNPAEEIIIQNIEVLQKSRGR
jgi:tetratricopeptide (TPR) repeat protein